jgi:hypothetical protein
MAERPNPRQGILLTHLVVAGSVDLGSETRCYLRDPDGGREAGRR